MFSLLCWVVSVASLLHASYTSFKALRSVVHLKHTQGNASNTNTSESVEVKLQLKQLLEYWVVLATFSMYEYYLEVFLSWLPIYFSVKLLIQLWVAVPQLKGSNVVFEHILAPMFSVGGVYWESVVLQKGKQRAAWILPFLQAFNGRTDSSTGEAEEIIVEGSSNVFLDHSHTVLSAGARSMHTFGSGLLWGISAGATVLAQNYRRFKEMEPDSVADAEVDFDHFLEHHYSQHVEAETPHEKIAVTEDKAALERRTHLLESPLQSLRGVHEVSETPAVLETKACLDVDRATSLSPVLETKSCLDVDRATSLSPVLETKSCLDVDRATSSSSMGAPEPVSPQTLPMVCMPLDFGNGGFDLDFGSTTPRSGTFRPSHRKPRVNSLDSSEFDALFEEDDDAMVQQGESLSPARRQELREAAAIAAARSTASSAKSLQSPTALSAAGLLSTPLPIDLEPSAHEALDSPSLFQTLFRGMFSGTPDLSTPSEERAGDSRFPAASPLEPLVVDLDRIYNQEEDELTESDSDTVCEEELDEATSRVQPAQISSQAKGIEEEELDEATSRVQPAQISSQAKGIEEEELDEATSRVQPAQISSQAKDIEEEEKGGSPISVGSESKVHGSGSQKEPPACIPTDKSSSPDTNTKQTTTVTYKHTSYVRSANKRVEHKVRGNEKVSGYATWNGSNAVHNSRSKSSDSTQFRNPYQTRSRTAEAKKNNLDKSNRPTSTSNKISKRPEWR